MRNPRFLLSLIALILLAVTLGSIARSQPGGSWLVNSYWLLYGIAILPLLALAAMVVMVIFLVLTWKTMSDVIGHGMAKKAQKRRRGSNMIRTLVFITTWSLAIMVLFFRCGGISCRSDGTNSTSLTQVITGGSTDAKSGPIGALAGFTGTVGNLVQSEWFVYAFVGLLVISGVVIARSVFVAWSEWKEDVQNVIPIVQLEGLKAVQDAIQIVQSLGTSDPRERVLMSYQRMIKAAADNGALVTPDQTARELEKTIRTTFWLKGSAIHDLTNLFEEARYSEHPMTEGDSEEAYRALTAIKAELSPSKEIMDNRPLIVADRYQA